MPGIKGQAKPRWSDAELEQVRMRYPHERTDQLAAELKRSIGSVQQAAVRMKLAKTAAFMASPESGRLRAGHPACSNHPVGTIMRNGVKKYLWVKLEELGPFPAGWRLLHHHVWESAHGPIPPDHVVAFRNGERTDTALENLELVSRHDWAMRHAISNLPSELISVIAMKMQLMRAIAKREAKQSEPPTTTESDT